MEPHHSFRHATQQGLLLLLLLLLPGLILWLTRATQKARLPVGTLAIMCGGAIIADFVPAGARRPASSTVSASILSGTIMLPLILFFYHQLAFCFVVSPANSPAASGRARARGKTRTRSYICACMHCTTRARPDARSAS